MGVGDSRSDQKSSCSLYILRSSQQCWWMDWLLGKRSQIWLQSFWPEHWDGLSHVGKTAGGEAGLGRSELSCGHVYWLLSSSCHLGRWKCDHSWGGVVCELTVICFPERGQQENNTRNFLTANCTLLPSQREMQYSVPLFTCSSEAF